MTETASINAFLALTLRSIRADQPAEWIGAGETSDMAQEIWGRIEYHGIVCLLQARLSLLQAWPRGLLDHIASEARLISLWEATHKAAVSDLMARLVRKNIASVVLKGTALAYWLYDDPSARRRGDTDLLVRPADLARARSILSDNGWRCDDEQHTLNFQEVWRKRYAEHFDHSIDLHWAPSDSPALRELLSESDCFAHSQPLPALHEDARRSDAAFMMVHAAINRKWHSVYGYHAERGKVIGSFRLIWSVDFDLLVRNMHDGDWDRLVRLCETNRAGPLVAEALRSTRDDLETSLPAQHMAALESHALHPDLAQLYAAKDELTAFLIALRSTPDWRNRGRMVAARALAPRTHLAQKYPRQAHWPIFILRARLVVSAVVRIAKRGLRA